MLLVLRLFLAPCSAYSASSNDIVNSNVLRRIDAASNLVKITTLYTVDGVQDGYNFVLPKIRMNRLAHLEVMVNDLKANFTSSAANENDRFIYYRIPSIGMQNNLTIVTSAIYTEILEPYPKEILQTEKQYMRYVDNVYVPSPYTTLIQETGILLSSPSPLHYHTGVEPMRVTGKNVIFGPYENLNSQATMGESAPMLSVHYANHAAFAKISTCLREIEVSHWGNIAVEEFYDLEHHGAKLKGEFSRIDHKAKRGKDMPESPSFRRLLADLPPRAHGIYYRDNIGNVSTSAVFQTKPEDPKILVMDTRYPLYGGWKIAWYQGYNIPSEDALTVKKNKRNEYTLSMNFGMPFPELWAQDLTIKVILPEAARDITVEVPFEVEQSETKRYTYLDSPILGGRPVVILNKQNVVSEHNVKFKVHYTFGRAYMLHEPLLLVAAYFLFFVVSMVVARLHGVRQSSAQEKKSKKE